jgi:probable F420-dependent oxidoreductase
MSMAITANDLQRATNGRLVLGLGSQIKAHIERRFSMPWSHPAPRMREFVLAMRAIWSAWNEGTKLDFRGDFYTHTLMTPFFCPPPNPFGTPKVWLAAVGPHMTEVAGEVCDGMLVHAFTTERYMREVTIPALERGFRKAGRTREGFEVSAPLFVVTGTTEEARVEAARGTKQQIAFYGSTPAYRPVLDLHGWGEIGDELNTMSKRGLWVEMGDLVTDEILETFAVVAEPGDVAPMLRARYGPLVDRIGFYTPYPLGSDEANTMIAALKE